MNLFKNLGNTLKDNFMTELKTKPRSKTSVDTSTIPQSSPSRTTRTQSLSQISALHSHRNMKISLQVQLAESMFDSNYELELNSKLSPDFQQCLEQQNLAFPFFVQFVDCLDAPKQILIKSFLQAKCLVDFIKTTFGSGKNNSKAIELEQSSKYIEQFYSDFERILHTIQSISVQTDFNLISCNDYESLLNFYQKRNLSNRSQTLSFEWQLFECFTKQVEHELEEKFYSRFLCSKYFRMLEYEVLCDTEALQFSDILYASTPIASTFLEFMDQEGLKRFVEFLIMHRNFCQYSKQLADALAIYNRFFNLANKCSSTIVELSDKSYKIVEDSLQGSAFTPNCFDRISSIFVQYFSKTYFPQFLQSELFTEYLKSCEDSFKSLKNKQSQNRNKTVKQISIESCPDVSNINSTDSGLWKRNDGAMNLTFIDNYGRINSLFQRDVSENVGQQNTGGKLSQVIKKLTLNDEDEKRRKEEDAWRIAQSIINDVCSVTSTAQLSFTDSQTTDII